jgi:hypothetical protein
MTIKFKADSTNLDDPKWDTLRKEISEEITEIRTKLEIEHGPIDSLYQSIVVNFRADNKIMTQFDKATKIITINLPEYDIKDAFQRSLNLAHELTHTLAPIDDPGKVTNLEEGLCTVFSEKYVGTSGTAPSGNYSLAATFVRELLKLDPKIIQKMRREFPQKPISQYTVEDLASIINQSIETLLKSLVKHFYN